MLLLVVIAWFDFCVQDDNAIGLGEAITLGVGGCTELSRRPLFCEDMLFLNMGPVKGVHQLVVEDATALSLSVRLKTCFNSSLSMS